MPLLISANLGRHVDNAEFLANVRRLDEEAGRGVVFAPQEVDEADAPDEHAGLRRLLPGLRWAGWATHEPIGLGERWTSLRTGVVKGSRGLARLSPARTITEVVARHESGAALVVLNLHYPRRDPRLWLRWQQLRRAHRARIRYWVDRGYSVVWLADVNRTRFARLHPDERTVAHRGLDWIRFIPAPGGARMRVLETGTIDMSIDGHDAVWARVELLPARQLV